MSPCPKGTISYRIKPGDTYTAIAKRFNTTVAALISSNPGVDSQKLQVNQPVFIPVRRSVVPCSPESRYIIRAGDSFSRLSRKYGLSIGTIASLNPGVNPDDLRVGQVICLPVRRRRRS